MSEVPVLLQSLWDQFARSHGDWLSKHWKPPVPLYCLPSVLVQSLRPEVAGERGISRSDVQAELDFGVLCRAQNAVGFLPGKPILFDLLGCEGLSSLNAMRAKWGAKLGWNEGHWRDAEMGLHSLDSIRLKRKAAAGFLLTEPAFLLERDRLRAQWELLDIDVRSQFPLPLPASIRVGEAMIGDTKAPRQRANFQAAIDDTCKRWSLRELTTWDLPMPTGPVAPGLDLPAHLHPRGNIVVSVPAFGTPTFGSRELKRIVADAGQAREVPRAYVDLHHEEIYGHMLDIAFFEQVADGRYAPPRRRGWAGVLTAALARAVDLDVELVQKYRKGIRRCLRGGRASIRWLK